MKYNENDTIKSASTTVSRRRESVMPRPRGRIRKQIVPRMYKSRRCRFSRNVRHRHKTRTGPGFDARERARAYGCINMYYQPLPLSYTLSPSSCHSSPLFLPPFLPLPLSFLSRSLARLANGPAILSITRYPSRIAHLSGGKIRSVS